MEKEIIEYGKKRTITIDKVYSYDEAIKGNSNEEDYTEFLTLTKGDDYSFYYFNGTFDEKVGTFIIESDSVFIKPFLNLIQDTETFKVVDDYSDRFIEFSKNGNGEVKISIHLLPGEIDGTIELKNVMHDQRSKEDVAGTNTKERLSIFFDQLIEVINTLETNKENTLIKKLAYPQSNN